MIIDHHPFLSGNPEFTEAIQLLKKENTHFSRLLREYEGLDMEICRAESLIPGYLMSDIELSQLKKEKLHIKDALVAMLQHI